MDTSRKKIELTGKVLARNTLFNLVGQATPLLAGIITIPLIVHGLGKERFGLLSLAWVVLGYFMLFDIGLGRATTKFVAEALGKGEERKIPNLVWTAVMVQGLFGLLGASLLSVLTPLLAKNILNISPDFLGEAKATFYLLALSIPMVLISNSFSGVLEAAQRFDLVNMIRIPSGLLTFLLPLLGLLLGFHLPGILVLILISRFLTLMTLAVLDLTLFPTLREFSPCLDLFPKLFSFGGWVMISSIIGPVMVYLDRFLIGSLLAIGTVTYYTAPYDVVTRLWIIPISLTMSLFPAFSTFHGTRDREKIGLFFTRSLKFTLLTLGPIVLILILFAKRLLQMWLGEDFAFQSAAVLQILGIGVFINSMGQVPYTLLYGMGRPDLPAKFHLLELPLYILMAFLLIAQHGIVGAAIAWALRVLLDTVLLFFAISRVLRLPVCSFSAAGR
ncbi:MAG: flippase [Thermodesulfobacteriota bacterium]